jgi:hypothetical protein
MESNKLPFSSERVDRLSPNQTITSPDLVGMWDLPYHVGKSLGFLGQYCCQGSRTTILEKALKHLVQEYSNTYLRGRKDCQELFQLSPAVVSQTWLCSSNIKGVLSHIHQMKNQDSRLHHTEQAIKYLETELTQCAKK